MLKLRVWSRTDGTAYYCKTNRDLEQKKQTPRRRNSPPIISTLDLIQNKYFIIFMSWIHSEDEDHSKDSKSSINLHSNHQLGGGIEKDPTALKRQET